MSNVRILFRILTSDLAGGKDPCKMNSQRLSCLHNWQRYYGMEPRNDSRLTRLYAEGRINDSPDAVARELVYTDYIFKTTLYGEFSADFFKGVANRLKVGYPSLTWTDIWEIATFYSPIALKLLMVLRCGIEMPDLCFQSKNM